jgi:predicted AlkP superfamily phosphohydrolase/phosphomutase
MVKEGAYSKAMLPLFPSLTLPSHTTEVTGVGAAVHGITGNSFYDSKGKKASVFPSDESMMEAEPIWRTATRQGVRTAVMDWPLSMNQKGKDAAAYFTPAFDPRLSDDLRLNQVVAAYEKDDNAEPLRLLIGYVESMDSMGHRYGPEGKEVEDNLRALDAVIEKAVGRVQARFDAIKKPGDRFYVVVTTDHGMAPVKYMLSLDLLLAEEKSVEMTDATGPVGNVFMKEGTTKEEMDRVAKKMLSAVEAGGHKDCMKVYRKDQLPAGWEYGHATRTGDLVVALKEGYMFAYALGEQFVPTADGKGPAGMHGYPVEEVPACRGFMAIWRDGEAIGGKDLGEVSTLQIEPTVAGLLGIKPAEGVKGKALALGK